MSAKLKIPNASGIFSTLLRKLCNCGCTIRKSKYGIELSRRLDNLKTRIVLD